MHDSTFSLFSTPMSSAPGEPSARLGEHEPVGSNASGEWNALLFPGTAEMGRMMDQIRMVAPQETNILLEGETGTGKTRLARLIHNLSPRRTAPYLVINCAALAESLIESEMFGHIKGSFTGAERDRAGKFAEVGRGTLLLDDIDALPLVLQAKLLRAVEERVFEPVGSNKPVPVQARLIAASSRPLEREVAAGRFRADLYFRLNVVAFGLPPLRERRASIWPLAYRFVTEYAARNGRPVRGISPEALRMLEGYRWPGNIRELRNTIERAVSLCAGVEIQPHDLPETVRPESPHSELEPIRIVRPAAPPAYPVVPPAPPLKSHLSQIKEAAEISRIIEALERHQDNRLRAARELGISRMTLYKKLHKYGMMDPGGSAAGAEAPRPRGRLADNRMGDSL